MYVCVVTRRRRHHSLAGPHEIYVNFPLLYAHNNSCYLAVSLQVFGIFNMILAWSLLTGDCIQIVFLFSHLIRVNSGTIDGFGACGGDYALQRERNSIECFHFHLLLLSFARPIYANISDKRCDSHQ